MSLESLAAGVLFVGLVAYALLGGADFGSGFWSAFAFGPRAKEVREAMFRAMGPVWETNHVWLILVLVTLWTAFPVAFGSLFEALFLPLTVALVGIVFRGAAFAFRHYGSQSNPGLPATGLVFSVASILTPFAMGVSVGAVINGGVPVDGPPPGIFEAWLEPFPLLCGLIALAICAFLTPFYMLIRPLNSQVLEGCRRLGFAGSLALGALTALAIPLGAMSADDFSDRLLRPLPIIVMVCAATAGLLSLLLLWQRTYRFAPMIAGATVVLVLAAWGAAQYPYMLMPATRIEAVAAGHATLEAFLIALPLGALILVPSLLALFLLFAEADPNEVENS